MNTDVKCGIIEASSNELLYQIEVHNGLIPAYIVKKHDGPIPYIHKYTSHGPVCGRFFFPFGTADHALRLGPYMRRSSLRKLLHGHRWSHAARQIIKAKTQTTKNRQDADPPARFASHHPKDSNANSERGKSPTETTTKDLPRTQW